MTDHEGWDVKCETCGNDVDMVEDKENCVFYTKCEHCKRSFDEIENKYEVLKGQWDRLLTMYSRVGKCYSDLQDHIKCILT